MEKEQPTNLGENSNPLGDHIADAPNKADSFKIEFIDGKMMAPSIDVVIPQSDAENAQIIENARVQRRRPRSPRT